MLQKIVKCYFVPLPRLSYIYWLIHFNKYYSEWALYKQFTFLLKPLFNECYLKMNFLDTFVKNNKVLELCKFCSKWVQLIKLGAVLKKFCSLQFPSQKFKNRNGIWKWTIHNLKWFQFKTQSFFYFFRLYKGYLLPDGTTNNWWFLRHNGRKSQHRRIKKERFYERVAATQVYYICGKEWSSWAGRVCSWNTRIMNFHFHIHSYNYTTLIPEQLVSETLFPGLLNLKR